MRKLFSPMGTLDDHHRMEAHLPDVRPATHRRSRLTYPSTDSCLRRPWARCGQRCPTPDLPWRTNATPSPPEADLRDRAPEHPVAGAMRDLAGTESCFGGTQDRALDVHELASRLPSSAPRRSR